MNSARKQRWQQATALVSLSTAGAMTGIAFAHGTLADMTSPSSMPAHLLAFKKAAGPATSGDGALRSAIVSAAQYYLRLARGKTPAEMEALIWQGTSTDGADHGESCAAFASLTLEAGAQATGQQSWVTGGTTYPWPLHQWADVRVDPNADSPGIISILQDAEAQHRWHPLGDGYTPQPGDWVMFAGHVEVVTQYSDGVLYTIGGDSMPNLSVNAHQYDDPLGAQGVTGFVNNGELLNFDAASAAVRASPASSQPDAAAETAAPGQAVMLGLAPPNGTVFASQQGSGAGSGPQAAPSAGGQVLLGAASIPGAPGSLAGGSGGPGGPGGSAGHRYSRSQAVASAAQGPDTGAKQAFIQQVAPGAIQAQKQYGIPAAVTIAQAIDESGWGQSQLAAQDNNLFGIKGTGPAGYVTMPTLEYENGQWVTVSAPFRVYHSVAESIADHSLLLATGSSYKQAIADRQDPDTFANDLTGVYATDPNYGANLITIMRQYNLYRFGSGIQAAQEAGGQGGAALGAAALGAAAQGGAASGGAVGGGSAGIGGSAGTGGGAVGGGGAGTWGGASSGGTAPGVVSYGPALGTAAYEAAGQNTALQGVSSVAAHIPGAGGPSTGGPAAPRQARGGARARVPGRDVSPRGGGRATGAAAAGGAGLSSGTASRTQPSRAGARGAPQPGTGESAPRQRPAGLGGAYIPGTGTGYTGSAAPAGSERPLRAGPRNVRISTRRYVPEIPQTVTMAFVTTAKTPLLRSEPLYRDVARDAGVRWQLLAACDWMQCRAQPRVSPVYGEKLGSKNRDGTVYRTKSSALEQCARDLIDLAGVVYGIDLTERLYLSVGDLANVFAAFRWGGLLAAHHISAMEFPYSVEGLTAHHLKMRWPDISDTPKADKPGGRFGMAFGAVPIVLGLDYPAVA